jgi:hypothetical protein
MSDWLRKSELAKFPRKINLGQNSGFYKKNFAESKKEFCLLMPVPRPKLIRVEARAETQSFLVSLKFSVRAGIV